MNTSNNQNNKKVRTTMTLYEENRNFIKKNNIKPTDLINKDIIELALGDTAWNKYREYQIRQELYESRKKQVIYEKEREIKELDKHIKKCEDKTNKILERVNYSNVRNKPEYLQHLAWMRRILSDNAEKRYQSKFSGSIDKVPFHRLNQLAEETNIPLKVYLNDIDDKLLLSELEGYISYRQTKSNDSNTRYDKKKRKIEDQEKYIKNLLSIP